MAGTSEDLRLGVETAQAEANLRRLTGQFQTATSALTAFTNKLDITTKMSTRFGYGIATAMTNVVASVAAAMSVEHFAKFDNAMRNINTLAKMSEKGFGEMRREVLDLSTVFGKMPGDATAAMKHIISSGVEMKEGFISQSDAMKLLRVSSALSVSGQAELDGTTKLMVRTMIAYGKSMSDAEHVADVLFQTVNRGIVEFPELTKHLGELMGIAATARIPLEDLMGVFVAITKQLNPAEAVTAFRTLIMTLAHPPPAMQKEFDAIGVKSVAAAMKTKGLIYVMEQIRKMSGGGALERLFTDMGMNQKTVKGLATAFSENPAEFAKDIASVKDPWLVQAANMNAFREQSKAFGQEMNRFKASLASIGLTIVQQVEPSLTRIMKQFNDAAPKVMRWVEANKELINDLLKIGTAFGGLFALEMSFIVLGSIIGTVLRPLSIMLNTLTAIGSVGFPPIKSLIATIPFKMSGKIPAPTNLTDSVMREWETLMVKQHNFESGKEGAKPLKAKESRRLGEIDGHMRDVERMAIPYRDHQLKVAKIKQGWDSSKIASKEYFSHATTGFSKMGGAFKSFGKSFKDDFNDIPPMSIIDHLMNNSLTGTKIDAKGRRQYISSGNRVNEAGNMMKGFAPKFLNPILEFKTDKGGSALKAGIQSIAATAANMLTPFKKSFDLIERSFGAIFTPAKWMTMFKGLGAGMVTVFTGSLSSIWALFSGGIAAGFASIGGVIGVLNAGLLGLGVLMTAFTALTAYALIPGKSMSDKFRSSYGWIKQMYSGMVQFAAEGYRFIKDFFSNFEDNSSLLLEWLGRNWKVIGTNIFGIINSIITTTEYNIRQLFSLILLVGEGTILWLADNWNNKMGQDMFMSMVKWIGKVLEKANQALAIFQNAINMFNPMNPASMVKSAVFFAGKIKSFGEVAKEDYNNVPLSEALEKIKKINGDFKGILNDYKALPVEKFQMIKPNNWGITSGEDEWGFGKRKPGVSDPNKINDDPATVVDKYTGRKSVEAVMAGSIEAVRFENKTYAGGDAQVAIKNNTAKTADTLVRLERINGQMADSLKNRNAINTLKAVAVL